jgi:hypothetical protein
MSPDGRFLYVGDNFGNRVVAFIVGADGSLTQIGTPVSTGGGGAGYPGMAVTPDGRFLYVDGESTLGYAPGVVAAFSIQSNGTLVGVTGSPFQTGKKFPVNFQSLVIAPDQSPTAAFAATVSGSKASFDASSSTDSDGSITRYDWNFGDGQTLANGGPTPTHTYATAGAYTVTLNVMDNEGCSSQLVYTGQTASCSGSAPATRQVAVVAPKLKLKLGGPKRQKLSRKGLAMVLTCAGAGCGVKAKAKVAVPRSALAKKRVVVKAKPVATLLPAGQRTKLRLKFGRGGYRMLARALSNGATLTARVSATAKSGGLVAKAARGVKLRGGSHHRR